MVSRYVVMMSMGGSAYGPIQRKGTPLIFGDLKDCQRAIQNLIDKNHLLPGSYDYIIFKEMNENEYCDIVDNNQNSRG